MGVYPIVLTSESRSTPILKCMVCQHKWPAEFVDKAFEHANQEHPGATDIDVERILDK